MHGPQAGSSVTAQEETNYDSTPVPDADRDDRPVVQLPIAALVPGDSPRLHGPDQEHVTRLAQIDGRLPPILVRRSDMRVIDGVLREAQTAGDLRMTFGELAGEDAQSL